MKIKIRKMLLWFSNLLFLWGLFGCYYQEPIVIKEPAPTVVIKEKEETQVIPDKKGLVIEKVPGVRDLREGVYYPDPTLGYVGNYTDNIFLNIWFNPSFKEGRPEGPPAFELPPNGVKEVHLSSPQIHWIYVEGKYQTKYGWRSAGTVGYEVKVHSGRYYWWRDRNYGWYLVIRQEDFRD